MEKRRIREELCRSGSDIGGLSLEEGLFVETDVGKYAIANHQKQKKERESPRSEAMISSVVSQCRVAGVRFSVGGIPTHG